MSLMELPTVSECSVDGCSYNHDGCHAYAITVSGSAGNAGCGTFIGLGAKGGLDSVIARVGACQRTDCTNNAGLECTAPSIRVGAGHDLADCLTFTTT